MSWAERSTNWRVKSEDRPPPQQGQDRRAWREGGQGRQQQAQYQGRSEPVRNAQWMNDSSTTKDDPQAQQAMAEGRRLYVGNMPYMAKTEDVDTLFQSEEYKVERITISIDPFTGRNPSYCFVELATKEQAELAMRELNGIDMLGRPVKIKPGVSKSSTPRRGPAQGWNDFRTNRAPGNEPPRAFQRWERTDASTHWEPPEGIRLFVGGLPRMPDHSALEVEIHRLFQSFAITAISKLISPHPSKAELPGHHYFCFVDLVSSEEAGKAMESLNGAAVQWGGKLRVNKARTDGSRKVSEREGWEKSRNGEGLVRSDEPSSSS